MPEQTEPISFNLWSDAKTKVDLLGSTHFVDAVERLVRTTEGMQRRLSEYQTWYNEHRVHGAHESHTPENRIRGVDPIPILYIVKGGIEPEIRVTRQSARGDPKLFRLEIKVRERKKTA